MTDEPSEGFLLSTDHISLLPNLAVIFKETFKPSRYMYPFMIQLETITFINLFLLIQLTSLNCTSPSSPNSDTHV